MDVDLLIRGGDVVDVEHGRVLVAADVAVTDGRVVAVDQGLGASATRTLDATGALVTPGLVDMHTHVFAGGGFYGLDPDQFAWRSGTTTWVDAGSAGAYTLGALVEGAARRSVTVRTVLNVSAIGLAGESYECRILENLRVDHAIRCVQENPGTVVGIKARIDHNTVGQHGLEPLRRASTVARETALPLMVHLGIGPPSVPEILAILRPGDILTHCATGVASGLVEVDGSAGTAVREAYDRGVVLDVGHGVGGFAFDVMAALLAAGCAPQTISSDLHATSVTQGALGLPTVMAPPPVALSLMIGESATLWGQLMAGATLVTIPATVLFLTFQRHLVANLTAGSVKG